MPGTINTNRLSIIPGHAWHGPNPWHDPFFSVDLGLNESGLKADWPAVKSIYKVFVVYVFALEACRMNMTMSFMYFRVEFLKLN